MLGERDGEQQEQDCVVSKRIKSFGDYQKERGQAISLPFVF